MKKTISILSILVISLSAFAQNHPQMRTLVVSQTAPVNKDNDTLRLSFKSDVETLIRNGALKDFPGNRDLHQVQKKFRDAQEQFSKNPDSKELEVAFVKAQKELFEVQKRFKLTDPIEPIFIVDGKRIESIQGVDLKVISSVSVLKDEAAIKKYGDKAKDGVVIVSTKKGHSHEDMEKHRLAFISKEIDLKDNQKAAFEKIYKRCEDMFREQREQNPFSGKAQTYAEVIKQSEISLSIPTCKLQMYKDLKKVLTQEQIVKLYNAERAFMSSALRSYRGGPVYMKASYEPKK